MRSAIVYLLASLPVVGLACAGDEFTSAEGLGNTTHSTTSATAGAGGGGGQGGGAGGATTGAGGSGGTTTGSGGTGDGGATTGTGGGGGTATTGGGGGTAGGGGGSSTDSANCTVASDCPGVADLLCIKSFQCIEGKCVPQGTSSGTPIKEDLQVPHDCKTLVCDGNGGTKVESDNDDGPAQDNVCATKSCEAGEIVSTPVGAEPVVSCGAGAGTCADGECDIMTPSCEDGVKNGEESDVDCGSKCESKACADGKHCADATDCGSGLCGSAKVCLPAYCGDDEFNSWKGETDKDCGGPCDKCSNGENCKSASDCVSGKCHSQGIWPFVSHKCE